MAATRWSKAREDRPLVEANITTKSTSRAKITTPGLTQQKKLEFSPGISLVFPQLLFYFLIYSLLFFRLITEATRHVFLYGRGASEKAWEREPGPRLPLVPPSWPRPSNPATGASTSSPVHTPLFANQFQFPVFFSPSHIPCTIKWPRPSNGRTPQFPSPIFPSSSTLTNNRLKLTKEILQTQRYILLESFIICT